MWWRQNGTFQFYPHFLVKCNTFYCPCAKFLSSWEDNSIICKIRWKKPAWVPTLVDHRESPLLSGFSDHTTRCSCPSILHFRAGQRGCGWWNSMPMISGLQPWGIGYTPSLPLRYLINWHRPGSFQGTVKPAVSQQSTALGSGKPIPLLDAGDAVIFRSCTELKCLELVLKY